MDKKWIERTILEHIEIDNCECGHTLEVTVTTAAAAIAQAAEEEVTGLLSEVKALREERDAAEAQVAVMAEALQNLVRIRSHVPSEAARKDNRTDGGLALISRSLHYEIEDIDEAWERVEKALAAAPKVLLVGGAVFDWDEFNDRVLYLDDNPQSERLESSKCYDVIVLECPQPPEHGQESEQEE